jgi:L-threonylcarbamoyladenylate synthase
MAGSLAIRRAGSVIRAGGVVGYPTEAVWGFGCDPLSAEAVARILALKERPASMGLILIAADFRQLEPWLEPVSRVVQARISATWPGPVTWVLPAQAWVPDWLRGGRGSLAVRVTSHAQSAALCRATGFAIVSTSANRSGRPPARTGVQVRRWFGDELDLILGGATGGLERPSEIRDALSGRPIRTG